ncbi:MAG: 30S ribosomal protein S9 [Patescibacteria group bacterium]
MTDKKTKKEYYYGKGGRKTSVAQARIYPKGKGKITVNDKEYTLYFPVDLQPKIYAPLVAVSLDKAEFDISLKVSGGGTNGQADASRHAIARALLDLDDEAYHPILKAEGFLTRDARKVERKKFGLRKARRSPQWSKR